MLQINQSTRVSNELMSSIKSFKALCRYELMWHHPDTRKMVLWGGTCMALPQQGFQSPAGCLVGTEGGAVFKCSLDATQPAQQAFAQVYI